MNAISKPNPPEFNAVSDSLALTVTYSLPSNANPESAGKTRVKTADGWRKKTYGPTKAATQPCTRWTHLVRQVQCVADLHRIVKEAECATALDEVPGVLHRFALAPGVSAHIGSRKAAELALVAIPGVSAETFTTITQWEAGQPRGPNAMGPRLFNSLLPIDIDDGDFPAHWTPAERNDLHHIAAWLRPSLPSCLREAGFVLAKSAGFGLSPGLKLRLLFLTDRPLNELGVAALFDSELPGLNGAALGLASSPTFDRSVWRYQQISFIAPPRFEDAAGRELLDPIEGPRSILIDGPLVTVPAQAQLDAIIARRKLAPIEGAVGDGSANLKTLAGALSYVSADAYEQWFGFGCACYRAVGEDGFPVWDSWSATSPKYDAEMVQSKWEDVRAACNGPAPRSAVTIGSIFKAAADAGWQRPREDRFGAIEDVDDGEAKPAPSGFDFRLDVYAKPGQGARYWLYNLFPNIAGEVGFIVAASGAGKSTFAVGLAAALATGADYLGARNRAAGRLGVLIVSAESMNDTGRSLEALRKRGTLPPGSPVLHVVMPEISRLADLMDAADAKLRADTGTALALVIYDTLSCAFAPLFKDRGQNASEPVTELVALLTKLGNRNGRNLATWVLDHTGKDIDRGARGSSAKDADAAAWLMLDKPRGALTGLARVVKVKGSADDLPKFGYRIEGVHLWDETLDRGDLGPVETEPVEGSVMLPATGPVKATRTRPSPERDRVQAAIEGAGGRGIVEADLFKAMATAGQKESTTRKSIADLVARNSARREGNSLVWGPASQSFSPANDEG